MTRLDDLLREAANELRRAELDRSPAAGAAHADPTTRVVGVHHVHDVWQRAARRRRLRTAGGGLLATACVLGALLLRPSEATTPRAPVVPSDSRPTPAPSVAPATVVSTEVAPPSDSPPVPMDDQVYASVDTIVAIAVLANDIAPDGQAMSISDVSAPNIGSARLDDAAGVILFTAPSQPGVATFEYTVRDSDGNSATARVTVNVATCAAPSPSPSLVADAAVVARGGTVRIDLYANDPVHDGTFMWSTPTGGSVSRVSAGVMDYTAPAAAGRYTFNYTVANGCGGQQSAIATVTVNRPPTAVGDSKLVDAGGAASTIDVLGNDSDPDGNGEMSVQSVSVVSSALVPATEALTVGVSTGSKSIFVTPPATATGTVTLSYVVTDGAVTATAQVTVTVRSKNVAPVAVDDAVTVVAGSPGVAVLPAANDTDANGDPLTVSLPVVVTGGAGITPVLSGNTVTFSAAANASGVCAAGGTFSYIVSDGRGGTATGTITVTVTAQANVAPVAVADSPGGSFTSGVATGIPFATLTANDTDENKSCGDALTIDGVQNVVGGSAGVSGAVVVVTPTDGVTNMTFEYRVRDSAGLLSNWVGVTITVIPPETTTTTTPPPDTTIP